MALSGNETWTINSGDSLTVSGTISGSGTALTASGGGSLTLGGSNSYSGGTILSSGVLVVASTSGLGSSASGTVMLNGGTLDLATGSSVNAYNVTVGSNATDRLGSGLRGAGITYTLGTLTIGASTLTVTGGANVTSGTAGLAFGNTTFSALGPVFDVASGANLTLGSLQSTGNFTKQDSGQLTLNTAAASARTSGIVTLTGGTMLVGNASALGTTGVTLTLNGGTLDLATGSSRQRLQRDGRRQCHHRFGPGHRCGPASIYTLGTLSIGTNTLSVAGGGNVTGGTAGLAFGATTLTGNPTFNITNPGSVGTTLLTVGTVTNGANTATFTGNGSFAQTGVWGNGTGGVTLGPGYTGTVTLSQANTFTGPVTIDAGTVTLENPTGLGPVATANVAFGVGSTGVLHLNGNNVTVVGLNTNATPGTPIIDSGSATAGTDTSHGQ